MFSIALSGLYMHNINRQDVAPLYDVAIRRTFANRLALRFPNRRISQGFIEEELMAFPNRVKILPVICRCLVRFYEKYSIIKSGSGS